MNWGAPKSVRGNTCGKKRVRRDTDLRSSHSAEFYLSGGIGGASALAVDGAATEVLRHQLSYFLCLALPASLVRSLEPEVVRGLFPDHISSIAAAVAGGGVACAGTGHGVHGGTVCGHCAAGAGGVPVFAAVGGPEGVVAGGAGQRVSGLGKFSGL